MSTFFDNKTILVVDDDPSNRDLVVEVFAQTSSSTNILTAANGEKALQILAKKSIDLLILDWEMPVLDGISTLRALKQNADYQHIPVLIYTGVMTETEHLVEAMQLGATDFLRKPTHKLEILARVQSILRQQADFKEKIRLEQENNQLLQREISSYLAILAHKNQVLANINEKASFPSNSSALVLKEIAESSSQDLEKEEYWNVFLQKFNHLMPNFLTLLNDQVSGLTPSEIKLCTFLRCGLENKSIAALLNISLAGVEKNRYRIRKKMNLQTTDSLEKYLFSLS